MDGRATRLQLLSFATIPMRTFLSIEPFLGVAGTSAMVNSPNLRHILRSAGF